MSLDEFTEVTKTSWGSRLGGSLKGILVGLVLIAAAVWVLFWNEGRAVTTARSLEEGAGAVIAAQASQLVPANEGKLIHLSGLATTEEILTDPDFGVASKALILSRKVTMYQWKETSKTTKEKNAGGSETTRTTYSYNKVWSESLIDSSAFKKPEGHKNPSFMSYKSRTVATNEAKVGVFRLSSSQVGRINAHQALALGSDYRIPDGLKGRARLTGSGLYLGSETGNPRVGDMRVTFSKVGPTTVSIVARQLGQGLTAYQTKAGDKLMMIRTGSLAAEAMFDEAMSSNTFLTWILRLIGFIIMTMGFSMILRPLSVVMDVIPILGNITGTATRLVAGLLSLVLSILIIAIAWLMSRPLVAVVLIAAAVGLLVLGAKLRGRGGKRSGQAQRPTPPPPPPPPPQQPRT